MDPKPKPDEEKPENGEESAPPKKFVGKRDYDLDPTRFGDWELNGRCIDF